MARFVLVHGAWHGGWCWRWVAEELEERGHDVAAPDLPCDVVGRTARDYARVIGPQPDAIVVGHSLCAQSVSLVEAKLRVYVSGLLPVGGAHSLAFTEEFGGFVRDGEGCSYWPDLVTCAARMYPDCTRAQVEWAFPQLRRQAPVAAVAASLCKHDAVVVTTRDAVLEPDWQLSSARKHHARVACLDSGHFPMLTQPDDLADLLDDLA
jgi:pimeloyl-ACP methyl ester carboxylesterase